MPKRVKEISYYQGASALFQTDGFGGLSSGLGDRQQADIGSWSLTTSTSLHKLMPERWGWNIPLSFSIRSNRTTPRFAPRRGDIRVEEQIAQIEENVKIASEFSPLSEAEMDELEFRTLPIVRQGLFFRRWEWGA